MNAGLLDDETIRMMNVPRCGNRDKGHTHVHRRSKRYALQGRHAAVSVILCLQIGDCNCKCAIKCRENSVARFNCADVEMVWTGKRCFAALALRDTRPARLRADCQLIDSDGCAAVRLSVCVR